jgi:uncharacterized protein
MNDVYASDARREAQRDLLAHPERSWVHAQAAQKLVAGYAYEDAHPHMAAPSTPTVVEKPRAAAEFKGKYLSITTFRRDGTGVDTPVWFVQEGERLLVQTDRDSYKVRRLRRNANVKVAVCTATGRLRGEQVDARAEMLRHTENSRAERLLAQKYRLDLVLIRPIRALQRMFRHGDGRSNTVIVAITPK